MKTTEKKVDLEGTTAEISGNAVKITGPKGTVERIFREKLINISKGEDGLIVKATDPKRNAKRVMNTTCAHLRNIITGVKEGYEYQLKVCSGHFPMNVNISGKKVTIKNFIGEKKERICNLKQNVEINLEKDIIKITGIDKEQVGQAAAEIEKTTKIRNKDRRVFMDGIYIISKA